MMKKKFKRIAAGFTLTAMTIAACFALVACGEAPAVELTGTYHSGSYSFFSAYPTYTYKQLVTYVQVINTYSDGSYMLIQTEKTYSGALSFDPSDSGDQNASVNDRGQVVKIYYGTFTATEEEGLLSIKIAKPTSCIYTTAGSYFNTASWTDEMGASAAGEGEDSMTAAEYLATKAFEEVTVTVDTATNGFAFTSLTVASV